MMRATDTALRWEVVGGDRNQTGTMVPLALSRERPTPMLAGPRRVTCTLAPNVVFAAPAMIDRCLAALRVLQEKRSG